MMMTQYTNANLPLLVQLEKLPLRQELHFICNIVQIIRSQKYILPSSRICDFDVSRRPIKSNGANVRKLRKNHTHSLGFDEFRHTFRILLLNFELPTFYLFCNKMPKSRPRPEMISVKTETSATGIIANQAMKIFDKFSLLFYHIAYTVANWPSDRGHKKKRKREKNKPDWIWFNAAAKCCERKCPRAD